jgi:hypothetical protein
MAQKYVVQTDLLDRIDHSAGYKEDGTPKRVTEHRRGEVIEFGELPQEQVDRFIDLGAIKEHKPEKEEKGEEPSAAPKSAAQQGPGAGQ